MEIITGVERRRRWRLEEKLRIVVEVEQAGASFADVWCRVRWRRWWPIGTDLIYTWRKQMLKAAMAGFAVVEIKPDTPALPDGTAPAGTSPKLPPAAIALPLAPSGVIEVERRAVAGGFGRRWRGVAGGVPGVRAHRYAQGLRRIGGHRADGGGARPV